MRAALLALTACYSPVVPEGVACTDPEQCPSGQVCSGGRCQRDPLTSDAPAGLTDAAVDALALDAPPDGPPACTPANHPCTGGYQLSSCSGMCFVRCPNAGTRAQAEARCQAWGGTLARLDTQAANTCANKADLAISWIGLSQDPTATSPTTGWTWATAALSFTAWGTNQPDDDDGTENGQQNCGAALLGVWEDVDCNATLDGFICRR